MYQRGRSHMCCCWYSRKIQVDKLKYNRSINFTYILHRLTEHHFGTAQWNMFCMFYTFILWSVKHSSVRLSNKLLIPKHFHLTERKVFTTGTFWRLTSINPGVGSRRTAQARIRVGTSTIHIDRAVLASSFIVGIKVFSTRTNYRKAKTKTHL